MKRIGHGPRSVTYCNAEPMQTEDSDANVTSRASRGQCSMDSRGRLDVTCMQAVAALRPRSLAAPGFSPGSGRFMLNSAAALAQNGSPQAKLKTRTAGWPMCINAVTQPTPPPLPVLGLDDCWRDSMQGSVCRYTC